MSHQEAWPLFRASWILHEDEALLVVAKPAGMASQAPDPSVPDDLVSRLGTFLRERGDDGYLGVHQRLDRETSGVLVFARSGAGNASLAAQFEGRRVRKEYLAVVRGWKGRRRSLRHRLARERGRSVIVLRGGKEAITHAEVVRRHGDRTLLRLRIETGRTHQIRAQLAHVGAPVLGDRLYGGEPAPRLMLHALALGLTHPDGSERRFEAPAPAIFEASLRKTDGRAEGGAEALRAALERRWGLGRADDTTTLRLLQGDAEGIPGLVVDRYAEWLVANLYDAALADEPAILDALAELPFRGIYVKRRPRQANELADPAHVAPPEPERGEPAPSPLLVLEHGMRWPVRLDTGIATGLYLDQRDARRRVRGVASRRHVLNLFGYTGSFSVAAGLGGAATTETVDASRAALAWAREALALNDLDGEAHRTTRADCFRWLERAARRNARFDLIICDPPTYASTKHTRWKSGRGWVALASQCVAVAAPEAELLLCSNDARMSMRRFRGYVREALGPQGTEARLRELSPPRDAPALGEHPLKRLWVQLGPSRRGAE